MQKKQLTIQLTEQQKEQMRKATGEAPEMLMLQIDGNEVHARPVSRLERTNDEKMRIQTQRQSRS